MIVELNVPLFLKSPLEYWNKYQITEEEAKNIWRKYKFLEYYPKELLEYVNTILHKSLTDKQLMRLLQRQEAHIQALPLIRKHEQTIHIDFFTADIRPFIKDIIT